MQILLDMTKPWLGKVGALFIQKEDASFRHTLLFLSILTFFYFNLKAYHCKGTNDSREIFHKIELIILRKQWEIHFITETLQAMKDSQASSAIERSRLKEYSSIQVCKYNLLVNFKYGVSLMLLSCQDITEEYIVEYFIFHRLKNFKSVEIESAFLPTWIEWLLKNWQSNHTKPFPVMQ